MNKYVLPWCTELNCSCRGLNLQQGEYGNGELFRVTDCATASLTSVQAGAEHNLYKHSWKSHLRWSRDWLLSTALLHLKCPCSYNCLPVNFPLNPSVILVQSAPIRISAPTLCQWYCLGWSNITKGLPFSDPLANPQGTAGPLLSDCHLGDQTEASSGWKQCFW